MISYKKFLSESVSYTYSIPGSFGEAQQQILAADFYIMRFILSSWTNQQLGVFSDAIMLLDPNVPEDMKTQLKNEIDRRGYDSFRSGSSIRDLEDIILDGMYKWQV